MENPLDVTTTAGETLARQIQTLKDRCESLERTRETPVIAYFAHSLVEAKANLPYERGTNGAMYFAQYFAPGTPFTARLFIFVEEPNTLPEKGHQVGGRYFEVAITEA